MTVKEIKECFAKFNLRVKTNCPDDHEITKKDIEDNKCFQRYVHGEFTRIVPGLATIGEEICYVYPVLNKIEIDTDEDFTPCGGEQELIVNAIYSIRYYTEGKVEGTLLDSGKCKINALVTLDNDLFVYDKPLLINKKPNNSGEFIEVNISASYFFKGTKYVAEKKVIQGISKESPWLIDSEPTQYITITLSNNKVSNKGGMVSVKVERMFTRIYYMKDSCGNKIGGKSEPNLIEDVTSKSVLTSSNKRVFKINKNIITVPKQTTGAPKRETTITARYLDKVSTDVLVQAEGGKVTYEYELSFENGTKAKFFDLETSTRTSKKVYVTSKEKEYIDGEYVSEIDTNKLNIVSDSKWVNGAAGKDKDGVYVLVSTTEDNVDKDNDREATLIITSINDNKQSVKLIVSQPSLGVVKEIYGSSFHKSGTYTTDELNNTDIYFHPYKTLIYENGETEEIPIEDDLTASYESMSENTSELNVASIEKRGDNYVVNINNFTNSSMFDIPLSIRLVLLKNGKKVYTSDVEKIVVKGNKVVDYDYELCFNGHNKQKTVLWENDKTPKTIHINSLKHELINGKNSGYSRTPYKISIYDNKGVEKFDDSFSVKILDDEIITFPSNLKKDATNNYVITQKESGLKINLILSYKVKKKEVFKIPLKVLVYSNNISADIWTGDNGYLLIDNKETIKLNPCWLCPTMKDDIDTAFDGTITLTEGKHTFETFNVICLEQVKQTHRECNIYREITVDKNTKNITLQIKL